MASGASAGSVSATTVELFSTVKDFRKERAKFGKHGRESAISGETEPLRHRDAIRLLVADPADCPVAMLIDPTPEIRTLRRNSGKCSHFCAGDAVDDPSQRI